MREIFVDTSARAAIEDARDTNHKIALEFKGEIAGKCRSITSNAALDETYTLLLMNIGYVRTMQFKRNIDIMVAAGILVQVHISEAMEKLAWEVFETFNVDKRWSFTDCTSRVVIGQRKIDEVFAFDHHFERMGFVRKP
jgi:predicted nucleic acid-binding protein